MLNIWHIFSISVECMIIKNRSKMVKSMREWYSYRLSLEPSLVESTPNKLVFYRLFFIRFTVFPQIAVPIQPIYLKDGQNGLNWQCCTSKTDPRILILIAMGAKPLF